MIKPAENNSLDPLGTVQQKLKAPKNQFNKFGNYKYRNCEDILESVKPLLEEVKAVIVIEDELLEMGGHLAIKATAKFIHQDCFFQTTAVAGIDTNRKGMDVAQSYGASSSYARKYALNGLLLIDDSKDPDATNTHSKGNTEANKDDLERNKLVKEFIVLAKESDNEAVKNMAKNINEYSDNQIKNGIKKLKEG